jgi:ferredoxin--NADP+ reductase
MTVTIAAEIEPFEPGQFVNLGIWEAGELLRRSNSIASAPDAPLEFYLTEVQAGVLTPQLFRLKPGDPIYVEKKPQGFFLLRYVPPCRELWMVATGTGLGPFIAMLRTEDPWRCAERVILVHGVRQASHLNYADELDRLAGERAGRFQRLRVVSREPDADNVLHGRVTTALADGSLEKEAGAALAAERSHVMLCGNPAMIEDMTEALKQRGLRRHRLRNPGHITIEKYW